MKELNITPTVKTYIQSITLKETLDTEYRRSIEDEMDRIEEAMGRFGCDRISTSDKTKLR